MALVKEQTNRSVKQIREPRKRPTKIYCQLTFEKRSKAIQWRNKMVLEQLDTHMQKKMNLDTGFSSFTKINSKWPKCKIQIFKTSIR